MNSFGTKDSSLVTENAKDIKQVNWDKCCFAATKFSTWDQPKEAFLSLHNIQSSQQIATELCLDKDYFYFDKKNMRLR